MFELVIFQNTSGFRAAYPTTFQGCPAWSSQVSIIVLILEPVATVALTLLPHTCKHSIYCIMKHCHRCFITNRIIHDTNTCIQALLWKCNTTHIILLHWCKYTVKYTVIYYTTTLAVVVDPYIEESLANSPNYNTLNWMILDGSLESKHPQFEAPFESGTKLIRVTTGLISNAPATQPLFRSMKVWRWHTSLPTNTKTGRIKINHTFKIWYLPLALNG